MDKPIAVTSAEAETLIERAATLGRRLVFQNRRWDGDYLTIKPLIQSGRLGEVYQYESAFEWWSPVVAERWKDTDTFEQGGGIFYDLAPHLIDQAIQLIGLVDAVHYELDSRRAGAGSDDDSFVTLHHARGTRTRLWMSAVAPASRPRFRIVGSERVATIRRKPTHPARETSNGPSAGTGSVAPPSPGTASCRFAKPVSTSPGFSLAGASISSRPTSTCPSSTTTAPRS